MPEYRQAHTVNLPVYLEEAWRRLKATYPHQSFGGLMQHLLMQYLLKAGFLFPSEIPTPKPAADTKPLKERTRKDRLTGDVRVKS